MRQYLDLNLVEDLAVVDTNNGSDHLGDDDHVTEVGLNAGRLLIGTALQLGLAEALDQGQGLALEATVEASTSTAVDEVDKLKEEG